MGATYAMPEYTWLLAMGILGAMGFGYATGSNDVANAFATSVGSRTLTMKQAVIIAAIFEFIGGMVLGRVSTNVIASGITSVNNFKEEPEFYAYGMCCALGVGTVWQLFASYKGYNVSATHTIIGSIIGFALVYDGKDAVVWADPDPGSFPPYKGVVAIILSWFISPILTGLASALIFFICRTLVMRHEDGYRRSYWILPPAVFLTTWINIFFVFTKGAAKTLAKNNPSWTKQKSGLTSLGCAAGLALLTIVAVIPYMKRKAAADERNTQDITARPVIAEEAVATKDVVVNNATVHGDEPSWKKYYDLSKAALSKGTTYDIHEVVKTDPLIHKIHENAEKFDPKVEVVFSYLQVFSAICVIFAHGAGEVGYMAGPLNGIYQVVKYGTITKSLEPKLWILVISCGSLVLGLATYGYNVTQAMGTMMCKLSPTRGFSAELATSMAIMIAAQYGLPTSSSQCITGGILGVGMLEGVNGVNWKFVSEQVMSWAATLVVAGMGTAALFSQGVYSPSKNC